MMRAIALKGFIDRKYEHWVDERVAGGLLDVFEQLRDQVFVQEKVFPKFLFLLGRKPTTSDPSLDFCPSHELFGLLRLGHLDGPFAWPVRIFDRAGAVDLPTLPRPIPNLHKGRQLLLDRSTRHPATVAIVRFPARIDVTLDGVEGQRFQDG